MKIVWNKRNVCKALVVWAVYVVVAGVLAGVTNNFSTPVMAPLGVVLGWKSNAWFKMYRCE